MNVKRALVAGAAGTAVMTMLMLTAPMMGMPKMAIGEMLGSFLGIGNAAGWVMHGMIGLVLAGIYGVLLGSRLQGAPAIRGALYGFLVFLVAQTVVMPMMGAGFFSGGALPLIAGSLMGHFVYGSVVGAVYGRSAAPRTASTSMPSTWMPGMRKLSPRL